jgi:hypothetical protein
VIVRDMWLTGFDAPPVNTLYVDKPMQGHGLMQAIARTNRIWRDKPGGLIVDYIGIGEELKKAIRQYTRDAGTASASRSTPRARRCAFLLDTLDVIRKEFFHGFDYAGFQNPKRCTRLLGPAMEHVLQVDPEPDEKGRNRGVRSFLDQVAKLTKAQALAGTLDAAMALREEIAFFQAVRVSLIKLTRAGESRSRVRRKPPCGSSWPRACWSRASTTSSARSGLGKPDISVLDEQFLAQIQAMPTKNLAAELLERLIADQVKSRGQKNAIQGKEFTDKLEEAIAKYQNRALTTVEVIEELIKLARRSTGPSRRRTCPRRSSPSTRRCRERVGRARTGAPGAARTGAGTDGQAAQVGDDQLAEPQVVTRPDDRHGQGAAWPSTSTRRTSSRGHREGHRAGRAAGRHLGLRASLTAVPILCYEITGARRRTRAAPRAPRTGTSRLCSRATTRKRAPSCTRSWPPTAWPCFWASRCWSACRPGAPSETTAMRFAALRAAEAGLDIYDFTDEDRGDGDDDDDEDAPRCLTACTATPATCARWRRCAQKYPLEAAAIAVFDLWIGNEDRALNFKGQIRGAGSGRHLRAGPGLIAAGVPLDGRQVARMLSRPDYPSFHPFQKLVNARYCGAMVERVVSMPDWAIEAATVYRTRSATLPSTSKSQPTSL